jgi:hypothetical protein
MRRGWLLLVGLMALTLPACTEAWVRGGASLDEYGAYRRYRLAESVPTRLSASFDYLKAHPQGRWSNEVRRWFDEASEARVRAAWDDLGALKAFLTAVPAGAAARDAAERIVALELALTYEVRRAEAFDDHVRKLDRRLTEAKAGREQLIRALTTWAAHLARMRQWGHRTHELDHELIYDFRLTEPEGRCLTRQRCEKSMVFPYAIPEAKAQSERVALMDVVYALREGGLQEITVTGPELFTRVGEALFVRSISPRDLRGRMEALAQLLPLVSMAVEPYMPAERCHVDPVSPVVFHRRCEGTELLVVVATELTEEDRLIARPIPRAAE